MQDISVMIEGGKVGAGAPLGPALGPTGVNIVEVVKHINDKTANFVVTKVPVKISVDAVKKTFEIEVGSPPMSALIKKELNLVKGSSKTKNEVLGNLSMQQVKKIAEMKFDSLNSYSLYSAAREVIGTAQSMGVQVEGKNANETQKEFEQGFFDEFFGKEKKHVKENKESLSQAFVGAAKNLVKEIVGKK
ncbi:MAG: 50S ribosomal protein L11 [Candidatus Diapherotrites archaeon]|nr:50S ribosomal protein L11 [Candidatus Diapherotrites archaeon]